MRPLAFLILGVILMVACNNQGYEDYPLQSDNGINTLIGISRDTERSIYDDIEIESPRSADAPPPPQFAYNEQQQPAPPIEEKGVEKKLIRTANLSIKVDNYEKSRKTLDELLNQFQAEVTNERQSSYYDGMSYEFVIRVLPADFESFITKIESLASFVSNKEISVQDVTRQYVDLETRLASKRAVIAQYRSLLQTAKSVEDVLTVSRELNQVIEDVESTEAQLRALRNDVQFSTINLTIFDEHTIPNVERENFFSRIGKGLFNGWQLFLSIVVGLITAWPVVLTIVAVVWFFRRWWKRRKVTKES